MHTLCICAYARASVNAWYGTVSFFVILGLVVSFFRSLFVSKSDAVPPGGSQCEFALRCLGRRGLTGTRGDQRGLRRATLGCGECIPR